MDDELPKEFDLIVIGTGKMNKPTNRSNFLAGCIDES